MRRIVRALKIVSDALEKLAEVITGIFMIFLTVLIFVAVLARYIFNSPVQWQYEATLVCLSWVVFIGMSMTFKRKEHMALTFVTKALSPKARSIWMTGIDLLLIAFLVLAFIQGINITKSTWALNYLTIPISRGLFYLAFPVGAAFSLVHLIYHVLTRRTEDFLPKEVR